MTKIPAFIGIVLCSTILLGCSTNKNSNVDPYCITDESFTNSDIVGKWESGTEEERVNTLLISPDGTYIQIIKDRTNGFAYESEPKSWRIEKSQDNIFYLHLQGMNLCVYGIDQDCVGTKEEPSEWYDSCTDSWRGFDDEGVLLILGYSEDVVLTPHGISLLAFQGSTEGGSVYYYIESIQNGKH